MNNNLIIIKNAVYDKCNLKIADFKIELESLNYDACSFKLNGLDIRSRSAKVTPKKAGQFVTFWKRNAKGTIEPFCEKDLIDFFVVNVELGDKLGQFVFPKSILLKKGIIKSTIKDGKRAFRVYPPWDFVKSAQATKSQTWQLEYFYEINHSIDLERVSKMYLAH